MAYINKAGETVRYQDSRQSPAARERRRIGRMLANSMRPVRTPEQVGAMFGISASLVRRIEEEALYKLAMAIRRQAQAEGADLKSI